MARRVQTVSEAEAEVVRLEESAEQWRTEAQVKSVELRDLEMSRGDQLLDGADPRELHAAVEDLRILVAGAESAAASADRKLVGARAEVIRAQSRDVQQRADAAVRVAEQHTAKVQALLAQLKELEGVDYEWVGPPVGASSWTIPQSDCLSDTARELSEQARALEAQAGDSEVGVSRPLASYLRGPLSEAISFVRRSA